MPVFDIQWLIDDEVVLIGPLPASMTLPHVHEFGQTINRMLADSSSQRIHYIADISTIVEFPRNIYTLKRMAPYLNNLRLQSATLMGRKVNPMLVAFSRISLRRMRLYLADDVDSALKNLAVRENVRISQA